jgi:hypothetical protein
MELAPQEVEVIRKMREGLRERAEQQQTGLSEPQPARISLRVVSTSLASLEPDTHEARVNEILAGVVAPRGLLRAPELAVVDGYLVTQIWLAEPFKAEAVAS